MLFEMDEFRQFLWREYDHQYMSDKHCQPYDDILPETADYGFDDWIEENLTKMQMVGHLCEFLAEREV